MAKKKAVKRKEDMQKVKQWLDCAHLPYYEEANGEYFWIPSLANPHYFVYFDSDEQFVVSNFTHCFPSPLPLFSVVNKDKISKILDVILKEYYEE